MMIKNIIFDIGEVLIKSDKTFTMQYYESKLKSEGFTEEEFNQFIKGFFKFSKEHDGENNIDKKYKKTVDKKWYPYYNDLIKYCCNIGVLCDYSKDLLKSLQHKGYKLYYLSNQNKWNWDNFVKKRMSPIMHYFDGGIVSCDVDLRKPDKKIYELLIYKYDLVPEECLFIDDKSKNTEAAKSCNMKARVFNDRCLKYLQDMDNCIKSSKITESKDASKLDDGFKTKSGKQFKLIDLNTEEALKYVSKDWRNGKYASIAICKEDDKLAGYVYVNKSGIIGPLKVYKEYRGYGVSELLMKEAINKYNGNQVGVYSDNEVAIKLYKKLGFSITDTKEDKDGTYYIMKLNSNK